MSNEKKLIVKEAFKLAIKNHLEGKTDIAQGLYNQILEIDPGHVSTLNNLGAIFKELGEPKKAKNCYEKAIEINPNYADAYNNLGVIFQELGEPKKAKSFFEKAIEINPNYADAYNNLGTILEKLNEFQNAKSSFEKAIEIDPNYINAHFNLGVIFQELGENQKAKDCYEKAIEINPNYINAHNNLGVIFQELGEPKKAKDCYEKAIEINPNNKKSIDLLLILFSQHRFNYKLSDDISKLKNLYIFLFRKNNIIHSKISDNVKALLLTNIEQNQLFKIINLESLLENQISQNLIKEELFHLMLQKTIIPDVFLEKLLTQLRSEILYNLINSNKHNLNEYFNFIISLAEQCWLNEYIYTESEKEIDLINKLKDKIENNKDVNELEIAILASYMPLKNIVSKLLDYKSTNILFNNLIDVHIKEPLREKELVKSITSFSDIDNIVSKDVRQQYEKNPYPRWKFTNQNSPSNFLTSLNNEIKPNRVNYNNKFNNPKVLIAGCGTGSHVIEAKQYKNTNILAVDLSLSSLAYAKRKTEELGLDNIEYIHTDILQLNKLNKKFDIIESTGVLHHMEDPIAGLKVLVDILEPHGFLKLGLYSKIARQHLTKVRELIKERNYKNTTKDIKTFRQDILDKKEDPLIQKVINIFDFYSTSMTRDLLFHVQEHCFTIPQILEILKDQNLEFLGFCIPNPLMKEKYLKDFPEDKQETSLDNWHQFELNNPDTFMRMYQFWLRKI